MEIEKKQIVKVEYKNWRGETAVRTIIPKRIYFGSTDWHPEEAWLMEVFDIDRQAERIYSIKDIIKWGL